MVRQFSNIIFLKVKYGIPLGILEGMFMNCNFHKIQTCLPRMGFNNKMRNSNKTVLNTGALNSWGKLW